MHELDDETWKLACRYCGGRDPRIPRKISVEVLDEYNESWTPAEFQALIAGAIELIPAEYREAAKVTLSGCDPEGYGGSLRISYQRNQNAQEVADEVHRALDYALDRQARERAEYKRLKEKFG